MDSHTFMRDLGAEVGGPSRGALTAARDRLLAEIENEAAVTTPARVMPDPGAGAAEGIAPVTPLEPRPSRGSRAGRVLLAAAAVAIVAAAAIGGVRLLSALQPDGHTTGPVPAPVPTPDPSTSPPVTTPPPARGSAALYTRLERTIEAVILWDVDAGAVAYTWADAESAVVTRARVVLSLPADPRGDADWAWEYADDCELLGVYGEQVDPSGALDSCRAGYLAAPSPRTHRATWDEIAAGDADAEDDSGAAVALALIDQTAWGDLELPREPAALLDWFESRADTFEMSWLVVMTDALAMNQLPSDLVGPMLEAVALVPAATTTRDQEGRIIGLDVSSQLGEGRSLRRSFAVDPGTGLVSMQEYNDTVADAPGGLAAELPDGGAWTVRTTITATPGDAPGETTD